MKMSVDGALNPSFFLNRWFYFRIIFLLHNYFLFISLQTLLLLHLFLFFFLHTNISKMRFLTRLLKPRIFIYDKDENLKLKCISGFVEARECRSLSCWNISRLPSPLFHNKRKSFFCLFDHLFLAELIYNKMSVYVCVCAPCLN